MGDSDFLTIARGLIEQLGHKGEEAETVLQAITKLRVVLNSKIARDAFSRAHHGDQAVWENSQIPSSA